MVSIFFDLDGVLADFVRGALKVHGREDIPYGTVKWGLEDQLGLKPEKFWEPMGYEFWQGLGYYNDGMQLLQLAEKIVGPSAIGILTAPCQTPGCRDGKVSWIRRNLPGYESRLFMGSAKELFAGPTKVLIDDRNENVWKWRDAGGQPVLVPRPWNGLESQTLPGGNFNVESVGNVFLTNYRVANRAYTDDFLARVKPSAN